MEELKFRNWDTDDKRFYYATIQDLCSPKPLDFRIAHGVEYHKCIFEQYSGLKDKNGVEIYDGDKANSVYGVGTVVRDERGFRFEFDIDSDGLWEMATGKEGKSFEVIGNIHEIPKWVNWFYSDYHQNGSYQGTNGGRNDDGIFDTMEDAKQYVVDNKVSNCTGQKEVPPPPLENNSR